MKNKFFNRALAVLCATTCALSLTACDDDDNNGGGYDGLKSDIISSAAEWEAAFDFLKVSNATIELNGWENRDAVYKFEDDKLERSYKVAEQEDKVEYFQFNKNQPYEGMIGHGTEFRYSYDSTAEKWVMEKSPIFDEENPSSYVKYIDRLTSIYDEDSGSISGYMHERYSDFVYSEEEYAYIFTADQIGNFTDIKASIKFKNNKIAEGYLKAKANEQNVEIDIDLSFKVYSMGSTVVTLPTIKQ